MLVKIPSSVEKTKSLWYVVVPNTEEQFFDDTAPAGISSMDMLLRVITNEDDRVFKPVVVFNSTPRRGEARHELRRLATERLFPETTIYSEVRELLRGVKQSE
jgi:hypothetical protein